MESNNRKVLLSLLCVFLAIPVGMSFASLVALFFPVTAESQYGIFVSYVAVFGFVFAISLVLRNLSRPSSARPDLLMVLWGFVTILLWNCVVSPLAEYLPDMGNQQLENIANTGWLSVLTAIVIGPFMEEWIFRGVMAENLKRVVGTYWAIVASAALFALVHVYPVQMLTALGAGLVLGSFYMLTRSIATVITMHILYNGFIYCLFVNIPTENEDILVDLVPSEPVRIIIWGAAVVLFAFSSYHILLRLKTV